MMKTMFNLMFGHVTAVKETNTVLGQNPTSPSHCVYLYVRSTCEVRLKYVRQVLTCLCSSVQRQTTDHSKVITVDSTVCDISVVVLDQQLHHVQVTPLTGSGQHPVQQFLPQTRT